MTKKYLTNQAGNILILAFTVLIIFFLFKGMFDALEAQDKIDCSKWSQEAGQYRNYYITKNQKDQCDFFGISINAPIRS